MLALHDRGSVHSLRHMPSWLMLSMAAGAVNAGGFFACERFVSHVTGNAMQLSLETGTTLLRDSALLLLAFIAGAMSSAIAIERRYLRQQRPLYALPLVIVAGLLIAVAIAGQAGVFGPFGGGTTDEPTTMVLLALLGFAMGLQNAAVATSTGLAVRSTHLTGPATDFGVQLATAFFAVGSARRDALQAAALRAGKIAAFVVGAALMVPLASKMQFLSFLGPAALVVTATLLSFLPAPPEEPEPTGARLAPSS
ncbi:putative transmembrane protein [Labilithrix luteola]|uniref:Putative transmembrane protein n=1 Tax=Labilithrix luteola TaxID=1391654 RepID=A0A0K1PPG7_9BACT|nr:YoaK family protein [Labilithrix luteola]AKU95435.1 putative transmembrane protein [Labilithrix luteola]